MQCLVWLSRTLCPSSKPCCLCLHAGAQLLADGMLSKAVDVYAFGERRPPNGNCIQLL